MRYVFLILLMVVFVKCAVAAPAVHVQDMPPPIQVGNGMVIVVLAVDNMPVEAARQQIQLMISPGGTVLPDERLHRLIIKDTPANIERIKGFLSHADVALPMVNLTVAFNTNERTHVSDVGVNGAVVTNRRVIVNGTAYDNRGSVSNGGTLKLMTMSGSEGVIRIGENVPYPIYSFFYDDAVRRGYITQGVVFQDVSTGFGVVPRVVGDGFIILQIYPRVSWQSPAGPGVVRYMDAAVEVRVRDGDQVTVAQGSSDASGTFNRILSSGRASSSQGGQFSVSATVARDPYKK